MTSFIIPKKGRSKKMKQITTGKITGVRYQGEWIEEVNMLKVVDEGGQFYGWYENLREFLTELHMFFCDKYTLKEFIKIEGGI